HLLEQPRDFVDRLQVLGCRAGLLQPLAQVLRVVRELARGVADVARVAVGEPRPGVAARHRTWARRRAAGPRAVRVAAASARHLPVLLVIPALVLSLALALSLTLALALLALPLLPLALALALLSLTLLARLASLSLLALTLLALLALA